MPPRWRVKNFLSNFKHTPATLKHVPMRISEVVITATFNISYRYVTALFFLTKKKQKQKKLRWRLICTSRRQGRHWGKTRKQKPRTYLQSSAIDYSYKLCLPRGVAHKQFRMCISAYGAVSSELLPWWYISTHTETSGAFSTSFFFETSCHSLLKVQQIYRQWLLDPHN